MNMSVLAIVAIVLAIAGVAACFVRRVPAVVLSYAGLLCVYFTHTPLVDSSMLVFWGIAVLLVLGISYMVPPQPDIALVGRAYVSVGAVAGSLLGFLVAPTVAAVILGGVVGALLGATAFRSTPRGPKNLSLFSSEFINFVCSAGLLAVVACSICGITAASVL